MSSDVALQDAIDEYEERIKDQQALDIAILIQQGLDRDSATQRVQQTYAERADAAPDTVILDEDGFVEDYLLEEMQLPDLPRDSRAIKQVKAIQKDIRSTLD